MAGADRQVARRRRERSGSKVGGMGSGTRAGEGEERGEEGGGWRGTRKGGSGDRGEGGSAGEERQKSGPRYARGQGDERNIAHCTLRLS